MKPLFYLSVFCLLALSACKKTANANDENEHEAINKIVLRFSQNGVLRSTSVVEDPDGDGGNPPTRMDSIRLQPGQTYTAEVQLVNLVNGVEKDITAGIQAQGRSHELFFLPSLPAALTVTKNDRDALGFPIGFNSTWVTGSAGRSQVQIKLMHKPGIKGPSDGPNVGHSDIDVNLGMVLQ